MSSDIASILIVEDSKPVRAALQAALTAAHYTVLQAASGEEGLTQAGEATLVLLDLGLPGISGFEVLATLRRDRSEEHTSELQSLMRLSYAFFCLTNKQPH